MFVKENQPFSQMKALLVEGDRGRDPGEKGVGDVRKGGVRWGQAGFPRWRWAGEMAKRQPSSICHLGYFDFYRTFKQRQNYQKVIKK